MSAKNKLMYTCNACGVQAPKWAGQCTDCGGWNTLEESASEITPVSTRLAGYAGNSDGQVVLLSEVKPGKDIRIAMGMDELDRVLGGGLVAGSVVLLGGDPGIGKSTLLLQAMSGLGAHLKTLYVSGEESPEQISLSAKRMGIDSDGIHLLAETRIERILEVAQRERPQVMVLDSIQTLFSMVLQSVPGSVAQVKECAAQLVRYAKQSGTALFLIGHVTKEGTLAGPRVLEHMVDTVLYFEGDPGGRYRLVRAIKNRFGAVNELGVFAMTDKGLREVNNPSALFLSRHQELVAGSGIMVTREGTRPLLIEVQALVDESHLGQPRRVTLGLEQNRLAMLLAVLHRHGGITMVDQDVFVNVVGGVKVGETAADLVVILAILSSFRDKPLPRDLIIFGEIGLAGEIRPVPNGEERLKEALKHGFKKAIIPAANAPRGGKLEGMEIFAAHRLSEVIDYLAEH